MSSIEEMLQWKEEMEKEHSFYSLGREGIDNIPVPVSPVELPPETPITQGTDSNQRLPETQEPFSLFSDHQHEVKETQEPEQQELTSPDSPSLSLSSSLNSPSPSTCFHCGSVILPGVPCGYCNRSYCYFCGSKDFWKSKAGRVICRVCHPPASGAEEVEQVKGIGNIAA